MASDPVTDPVTGPVADTVSDWKPIWLEWLSKWADKTASTHAASNYARCITSLRGSSTVYQDPSELIGVKFFGEKTLLNINRETIKYCKENKVNLPRSLAEHQGQTQTQQTTATPAGRTGSNVQFISPNNAEQSNQPKNAAKSKKTRAPRRYVPKYRSGGYAILVALYKYQTQDGQGIGKTDLMRLAKSFSDTSFEVHSNNINGFYGAWSSMNTLIKNNLVYRTSARNAHYILTPEGRETAEVLLSLTVEKESTQSIALTQPSSSSPLGVRSPLGVINTANASNANDKAAKPVIPVPKTVNTNTKASTSESRRNDVFISSSPPRVSENVFQTPTSTRRLSASTLTPGGTSIGTGVTPVNITSASPVNDRNMFKATRWPAGSFRIRLLLDNREVVSADNRSFFARELRSHGVSVDVVPLSVGDMVWVAEHRVTKQRAVLDYIAERKRLDDLVGSIRDGRLKEQKHRLYRSTLSHLFYVVEEPSGIDRSQFFGSQGKSVTTILSQTVVSDKFHLLRTTSGSETAKQLAFITRSIQDKHLTKPLSIVWPNVTKFREAMETARASPLVNPDYVGIEYDTFCASLSKSGNLTVKDIYIRMLMCIKGVTRDKAHAIQKIYPTPSALFEAYENCATKQQKLTMLFNATQSNFAHKKVGKKLSETIYETWGHAPVTV